MGPNKIDLTRVYKDAPTRAPARSSPLRLELEPQQRDVDGIDLRTRATLLAQQHTHSACGGCVGRVEEQRNVTFKIQVIPYVASIACSARAKSDSGGP